MDKKRVEPQRNKPKIILPRVKFTGQQPGEEGVERDDSKDEPGHNGDAKDEEEKDERGLPVGEPSTEGKFSV